MSSSYTFGDSDTASRRLELLSEVFAPTSRSFLKESVRFKPELALDLGCGPGHTTHMISSLLKPLRTVGIERSGAFLSEAGHTDNESVTFIGGDVTETLPVARPDLIFTRFLLSHLSEPENAVRSWYEHLRPGGLLLLEEVEEIRTSEPTLERYLEMVSGMLAHNGQELYIGPRLDELCMRGNFARASSRIAPLEPPVGQAARMFSMNLMTLRENEFVRDTYSESEISTIEANLSRLTHSSTRGGITWHLRQIALQRP